jgi:hypothetical protein
MFKRGKKNPDPDKPANPAHVSGPGDGDEHERGLRAVAKNTGDATASNGGFANSGAIGTLVWQEAARRPAEWPHQVGSPPGRALGFQDRAEAARLREVLQTEGTAVLGQVLSGLGGVGKTQLAADYARTAYAAGQLDVLVWVIASSRQAVIDAYTRAAVDLLGSEPDEHAAQRFRAWLQPAASRPACRWLVVFDDLADPADLAGLWPPPSPTGRTVVTTRRRDAALTGPGRRRVEVGVFTPAEAAAALGEALAERDHPAQPPEHIAALAADLGFLPLALSQAAAYIADAGLQAAAYRSLLADRARTLADLLPRPGQPGESGDALPDEQSATVTATWSLSLERADQLHPRGLARPMLQLTCMLDPNGIPETVLTSAPAREYLATRRALPPAAQAPDPSGPPPLPGQVDAHDAVAALRALHRLSLIQHTPDQPATAVRVHQLVQRTTRETLTPTHREHLAHTSADALLAAWPAVENDTTLAQALRANTTALDRTAGDALHTPDIHTVFYRAGRSLGETGQVAAARDYFHQLHASTSQMLGPDHPDTLITHSNLAHWRGWAGDTAGAASALAELLPDHVRIFGPDHPDTLTARGNLVRWQGWAGDAAGAAAAYAELLPDRLRVSGPDHPDTLTARHQLATFRGDSGNAGGAAAALAELLPDLLRVSGPDHPETLTVRHELARWRGQAGDDAGAAAAYAELLFDRLRVSGPDHPDTLAVRHNLAFLRGRAGDAAAAASALDELLPDRLRVSGPDHPETLVTRGSLARWRGEAGDPAGAASALAELLPDQIRVSGPDHPDTLATRSNLAYWRGQAGDGGGNVAFPSES